MKILLMMAMCGALSAQVVQPPNIQQVTLGQQALLTWNDTNGAGTTWNIYQLNGPCVVNTPVPGPPAYVGLTNTQAIISGLLPGTFCWAVTAVLNGVESVQSTQATLTILPGKYDDLWPGTGIQEETIVGQHTTISTTFIVTVGGFVVPGSCSGGTNDVYIQSYVPPTAAGQTPVNVMAIWLCNPATKTYFKPYFGNLIRQT